MAARNETPEATPKKTWGQREEEWEAREAADRAEVARLNQVHIAHNAAVLANNTKHADALVRMVEVQTAEAKVRMEMMPRDTAALERIATALEALTS
jgi:hypothetical protein